MVVTVEGSCHDVRLLASLRWGRSSGLSWSELEGSETLVGSRWKMVLIGNVNPGRLTLLIEARIWDEAGVRIDGW